MDTLALGGEARVMWDSRPSVGIPTKTPEVALRWRSRRRPGTRECITSASPAVAPLRAYDPAVLNLPPGLHSGGEGLLSVPPPPS